MKIDRHTTDITIHSLDTITNSGVMEQHNVERCYSETAVDGAYSFRSFSSSALSLGLASSYPIESYPITTHTCTHM